MASLDIFIILLYFVVVMTAGFYYARQKKETTKDFFLAGRYLGWFVIGTSLFATNISSEHFVGLAGHGATSGMAVGNFEWLAIFALILLGWIFAPIFLRARIYTVPEFFGKRYNKATQVYLSALSILAYVATKISVSLFAGGLLLHELLGWDFYTSAIVMMAITGIYTIVGGMRAVVYTSVIQAFFLIGGALVLTLFGLKEVGGLSGLQARLPADFFTVFRPADDPDFPWTGIVFGAPILAIWYWCTDQYIVQRMLCAKDVCAARSGAILTGFLKLLPAFILVLPGLIAAALFPETGGDQAYAVLLKSYLLPAGLKGLVFAGVLAALMSSLAASFISISTLFTMDFYRHFDPQAPEKKLVLVGRLTATAIVAVSILWIPLFKQLDSHLYIFLQSIQSYISPPIAAVFLLGIFFRRGNGKGAMWALVLGGLIGLARIMVEWMDPANLADVSLLFWLREINYLHFAIYLFVFSILIMITASLLSEAPFYSRIRELTFSGGVAAYALDSARGKRFNWMISATLVVVLFGLWGVFS